MSLSAVIVQKPKTRIEEVYVQVRAAILAGELGPGEKLSPSVLSEVHGVSLSTVREALTRLEKQGLVVSQPQLGFTVAPISEQDLLDLTSVRMDIEALALRRSVEKASMEWRTELVAAHYRLEHTEHLKSTDPPVVTEEWAIAHETFHLALLSGCDNARLLEIAANLRASAELYRRWSVPLGGLQDRDPAAEHNAIFEAAKAGDADAAVAHLQKHISHTTNVLLKATS